MPQYINLHIRPSESKLKLSPIPIKKKLNLLCGPILKGSTQTHPNNRHQKDLGTEIQNGIIICKCKPVEESLG